MSLPGLSTELSNPGMNVFRWVLYYVKPMTLPVLLAVVPTFYHYSNNVEKLAFVNLWRMLAFNTFLAGVVYVVLLIFHKFRAIKAANGTVIFLIFFNAYGLCYRYLLQLDIIRIKHYTLLPLVVVLAVYLIFFLAKVKDSISAEIWKNLLLVVSILIVLNLLKMIPAEIKKGQVNITSAPLSHSDQVIPAEKSPDIYYIVLDEFAGFQAMREYWGYHEVDHFVDFLKDRGFFVAEESHGSSIDTLHQMATRLNYREYSPGEDIQTYFNAIADNRVMRDLKSRGYTTVVFDETNMPYPSAKPIHTDYLYEYESPAISEINRGEYGLYFDEFGELVIDNTMFYAFSQSYRRNNPIVSQHSRMISFTVDNIASRDVPSPKFVYVHLMLPHFPFIFDRSGNITDSDHFTDWNHYLENYIYSIKVAEEMVNNILAEMDGNNPPVIILQSDHGARNHLTARIGSAVLPNYPEEFKTLILYALYLPGYDYSSLPQDIKPVNTFPVIFNHLFETNIALIK